MLKSVEISDKAQWNNFINKAGGHPLQLWGWGELKEKHKWNAVRIQIKNVAKNDKNYKKQGIGDILAAAEILTKKLPWPLKGFAYIPRGPVILSKKPEEQTRILEEIVNYCKNSLRPRPICVSIEPDWLNFPVKGNWKKAKNTILIPKTLILDLTKTDEELLSQMNKKTRQYIRKSNNEISVREIENRLEFNKCLDIYEETARRAGFAIHNREYYTNLRRILGNSAPIFAAFTEVEEKVQAGVTQDNEQETIEQLEKLIIPRAENENTLLIREKFGEKVLPNRELVAFLWPILSSKTSFELYGGMNEIGQKKRANFILKWLAIKQVQSRGVKRYDMNGLLNDGISNFKRGFAKHEDELCGTYDFPLSKWYFIWSNFLPSAKKIIRSIKKIVRK